MNEIDAKAAASLLGYTRKYFVDVVAKSPDFAPAACSLPRKMRWRYADVLAYKAGQRWSTNASQYQQRSRGNTSSPTGSGLGAR